MERQAHLLAEIWWLAALTGHGGKVNRRIFPVSRSSNAMADERLSRPACNAASQELVRARIVDGEWKHSSKHSVIAHGCLSL